MSVFKRLLGREEKASATSTAVAVTKQGQPVWTGRNYRAYATEGYQINAVAYIAISMLAKSVASIPLVVRERGDRIAGPDHPLVRLLERPNPREAKTAFFERLVSFYKMSGDGYVERVMVGRKPSELYALRPDRMSILTGKGDALVRGYRYEVSGTRVEWDVDPVSGKSDILHIKTFAPLDDFRGLAPMEPAARNIDIHNAAMDHNASLLQSGARPSGVMVLKGHGVTEDDVEHVRQLLEDRFANPSRAGKPMVFSDEVSWEQLSLSPADMDFREGIRDRARDICTALGVPHILVVPGESTYSNREDARLELWENSAVPLMGHILDEMNHWLGDAFGGARIEMDLDAVPALEARRETNRQRVMDLYVSGLITRNEARVELGYDPETGEDVFAEQVMANVNKAAAELELLRSGHNLQVIVNGHHGEDDSRVHPLQLNARPISAPNS